MIKITHTWDGNGAMAHIQAQGWDRIRRLTVFFWQACQTSLNVSNPRPYLNPAPKGSPPHKRTGFLAANVIYEFDEKAMTARVGVLRPAIYGLFLELRGWSWLKYTLDKVLPQLKQIAAKGS